MKSFLWIFIMPFLFAGNTGMDLGLERIYIGFQAIPNSSTVCKLVLQLKVINQGDVESPVCDLEFFASPVKDDKSFPCRDTLEVPVLASGASLDYKKEWRVDKKQADQICKDMCCGMMLVKAELVHKDSIEDSNSRNNEIASILLGKSPDNYSELTSLDSVFVKMQEKDKNEIQKELASYEAFVLKMLKKGNSACWINHENGYASIVHLKR